MKGWRMTAALLTTIGAPALAQGDQAFRSWATKAADGARAATPAAVAGKDGWLFFGPELRHLGVGSVGQSGKPDQGDPLPAIVDFKEQLEKAGIELLLVPVPAKATIYPERLPAGAPLPSGRVDGPARAFLAALAERGVKVLDLGEVFATAKKGTEAPLYCKSDTHWSGTGCVVAARAIAEELQRRPWYAKLTKQKLDSERKTVSIKGDLGAQEALPLRFVGTRAGDRLVPVAADRASPVLLLGDSHNLVFHAGADLFAVGAGLPDQLAFELGMPVDVLAVRGSGATPARVNLARRVRADPGYLGRKRVVVWCFSVRELTESPGWPKIALGSQGGA